MTHPRYTACDGDDGPTDECECSTLFGLNPTAVDHHLDADQKDGLLDHIVAREMALTELLVRVVMLALGINLTDEHVRAAVVALVSDDNRFNGCDDVTLAELPPAKVLSQIRLYADVPAG